MNAQPRDFMDKITEDDVVEAEQTVLSCFIARNELIGECGLVAEDFLEGLHKSIFAAALQLHAGHQHINAVSLKPFVPRQIDGLDISPAAYLARLMTAGLSPATANRYEASLQIIKGMTLARELGREAEFASTVAKEGHSLLTLGDEIEQLESRLKDLRARFSETVATKAAGDSYLSAFNASGKRDGVKGVPIGLDEIRRVLSESVFAGGNLYGLLSSSGEGKTSLTVQLIYDALLAGHPVLFLSYDQSAYQCIRQMIAQVHGISVKQQDEPNRLMEQGERDKCVVFATSINRMPLEIIRCQREGVGQLKAYARRFIKKWANGKTPFIVIDHIGKVKPVDPKLSADRISSDVTVELKALADETGSAFLVLNQRNSFGTRRDNPRPIAADLYGGEGAKADYDAILFLYRPEKYKAEREAIAATDQDWKKINRVFGSDIEGIAEIGVIKSRFGDPTIREKLKFEADFTRYVSMAPERPAELF
ncbi:replicative DNA helicase [Rhizobium rhizogenes]|uniref:replicative DNA helicase n=1 Tax=Rhizobium rhizogenes TaxID=359 RepID=UPI001573F927|nr:DnaB-like helicase C-terminal domain-containing protein [Rhizobium rhizogenes]NTF67951.1 helicase DnaB [Rhizobium rhizogenes]